MWYNVSSRTGRVLTIKQSDCQQIPPNRRKIQQKGDITMKNYITTRNNRDLFDEAFDNFFRPFYMDSDSSFMKTDIKETDKNYVMDVEMPGMEKKDINLKFESGYLTVSAKKETHEEEGKYLRRERATSFSRSYYMGDVDEKQIKAKYENGILTVTVPKDKPEEIKHHINID